MKTHTLETQLWLPSSIDKVFAFFGDAGNLDVLTPPWLGFRILTPQPIAMHAGARIDYKLRVHHVPIRWQTEITAWEPPLRFVDEQRRGPYKLWVHRHDFAEENGGTSIQDRVEYAVPGWIMEPLLHRWFVCPDLHAIFSYRQKKIRELLAPESVGSEDKIVCGQ